MSRVFGLTERYQKVSNEESRIVFAYGIEPVDENNSTWGEVFFYKKQHPTITIDEVKKAIISDINSQTDENILSGFVWNGKKVWLSQENQFNFKAAYDLAVQTNGMSLPVKFKLGETEEGEPVYHTFEKLDDITDFYISAINYINQCLNEGWEMKDGIEWSEYERILTGAGAEAGS